MAILTIKDAALPPHTISENLLSRDEMCFVLLLFKAKQ